MPTVRLLFVCTGNICRSPSAEFLLRFQLENRLGEAAKQIELSSAGLGTPGGWEIDAKVAELLHGARVGGTQEFRSRRVDAAVLAESDLVLTGTKQHRLTIGGEFPEAYAKTFTMREAVALLTRADTRGLPPHDLVERTSELIALLKRERGIRALADDQFDIDDPHGRRTSAYEAMFAQVRGVVDVLSFLLAPMTVQVPQRRP
jgi:protein-tyrosine phosphatase